MGRPKKIDPDAELTEEVSNIEKTLEKAYGKNFIKSGQAIIDDPPMIVPWCPSLDGILGGGIEEGTWIVVTGPEKYGKTTTILDFCATCQKPEYGSRQIWYLNIEGRLKKKNLTGIYGLNIEKPQFNLIGSEKGNILSAEQYLDIAMNIITDVPGAVVVIDSYSALCGENVQNKEMGKATMGGTGALQSRFISKVANIVPINKNIIIGVTQQTANLTGYGSPIREKTSNALKYQCDTKIKAKHIDPWIVSDKQIGQIVTWLAVESSLGPPGGETKSYIRYGYGLDKITEIIITAIDFGIIEKAEKGGWHTFQFEEEEQKLQGLEKVFKFFSENPKRIKILQGQIDEVLN